jgi:hypothetical protein
VVRASMGDWGVLVAWVILKLFDCSMAERPLDLIVIDASYLQITNSDKIRIFS